MDAMDAREISNSKNGSILQLKKKTTTVPVGILCLPLIYIDLPCQTKKKKLWMLNHSPGAIPIDLHRFSNRYVQPSKKSINIYKSTKFTYEWPKIITLLLLFVQPTAHPEGHTLTLHARMFLVEPQFRIAEIRGTCASFNLVCEECFGICDFQKNI